MDDWLCSRPLDSWRKRLWMEKEFSSTSLYSCFCTGPHELSPLVHNIKMNIYAQSPRCCFVFVRSKLPIKGCLLKSIWICLTMQIRHTSYHFMSKEGRKSNTLDGQLLLLSSSIQRNKDKRGASKKMTQF